MPPKLTIAATLELPHELRPRVLVIDVRKRSKLFKRFIKCRAEGYIVDILDKEKFAYIMHKIIMGKKFYDLDLLQELFDEDEKNGINKLTIR